MTRALTYFITSLVFGAVTVIALAQSPDHVLSHVLGAPFMSAACVLLAMGLAEVLDSR